MDSPHTQVGLERIKVAVGVQQLMTVHDGEGADETMDSLPWVMPGLHRARQWQALCFEDVEGQMVLDQLRTVDKARVVRRLGRIADEVQEAVLATLAEMFAP